MSLENLKLLPVEILEHIFSYLTTADIIKLSKVCYEFESLSHNTKLVRKVDLFNEREINCGDIRNFLCSKPRCALITILNLNCVYWIPAADIRRCLHAMISLECLYVVDTKLGLLKPDITTYTQISKLRRLGVSVSKGTFCIAALLPLPNITHLYLFLHSDLMRHISHILHKIDAKLEELWLVEFGMTLNNLFAFSYLPTSVKKFTYLLNNARYHKLHHSLKCWFKTSVNGTQQSLEIVPHQEDISYDTFDFGDNNWIHLLKLFKNSCPFSVKESKELFCKKHTLKSINFEEINMMHGDIKCGPLYIDAVNNVLLYGSMESLKKLSLGFCACLENEDNNLPQQKRLKLSNDVQKSNCLLQKISENSLYLEELELWSCQRANNSKQITNVSLGTIVNFQYLKKLTLHDIPIHINASFLIDVLSSSRCLSSIRIKSRKQNSSLHNMFCLSLSNAAGLKDIRYEHPGSISIDKFFEALAKNKNLKLERVFVKCESVEVISVKPLQKFIEFHPDLRFLYIVIETLPKTVIKEITNSLACYTCDRRNVFVVSQDECSYKGKVSIPIIHTLEMIKCETHISVLDVFNYVVI